MSAVAHSRGERDGSGGSWFQAGVDLSPLTAGVVGSLVAGLGTGLGALPALLRPQWSPGSLRLLLAGAGGMMLGASFFSLLQPALTLARAGGSAVAATGIVGGGLALGAVTLFAVHALLPHEHFTKGREGRAGARLGKHALIVLAIALHNFPEGLSVGVAYGSGVGATGLAVALSIAAQNVPEGLAVAAALIADGTSRRRAVLIAAATGLVEPLGGLAGALAVSVSTALLPWGLAFAAGAMLFVVSGEVIPETHRGGDERGATFAVLGGVVAMLAVAELLG